MPRPERNPHSADSEPSLPAPLEADLRRLYGDDASLPDELRDELLYHARNDLGNLRRSRRWGGIGVAAAAAMIIFATQLVLRNPPVMRTNDRDSTIPPARPLAVAPREDIDGNGRIDILDAFALARRLRADEPADSAFDFTADGIIDQRDIDAIAQVVVRLKGDA